MRIINFKTAHNWIVKDNQIIRQKLINLQTPYSDPNGFIHYNYDALCLYDMTSGTETQISPDFDDPDYAWLGGVWMVGDKMHTTTHDEYNSQHNIYCIDNFTNPDQIRVLPKAAQTNGDDSLKPIYTATDANISIAAITEETLFFMENERVLHRLNLTE